MSGCGDRSTVGTLTSSMEPASKELKSTKTSIIVVCVEGA